MTTEISLNAIRGLLQIAPKKDVRYYLAGVYFDPSGFAVATDGHCLAAVRVPSFEGPGFIVPRLDLELLIKRLGAKYTGLVEVTAATLAPRERGLAGHGYTPIDGKYPDWQRVVPTSAERLKEGETLTPDYYDYEILGKVEAAVRAIEGRPSRYRRYMQPTQVSQGGAGVVVNDSGLFLVMPTRMEVLPLNECLAKVTKFLEGALEL